MTPRQIELARHALGLDQARTSYRNYFVAAPGHRDYEDWAAMMDAGFATRHGSMNAGALSVFFRVTQDCERLVLRGGEGLSRLIVVGRHAEWAARAAFPEWDVFTPGQPKGGRRFDRVVMLWKPTDQRERDWVEEIKLSLPAGKDVEWLV